MTISQTYWDQYANNFTDQVELFIKKELPGFFFGVKRFDWSKTRRYSRGGKYAGGYGFNIAMRKCCYSDNHPLTVIRSYEYLSYDHDPIIGGFFTNVKTQHVKMIIIHEAAHALHRYVRDIKTPNIDMKPHGETFKQLYKKLRVGLLNHEIPTNQKELKSIYDEEVKAVLQSARKKVF